MKKIGTIVPAERVEQSILFIRGQKVMLSTDLAKLYGVEPRELVQAVKRNLERFPKDFMFQLTGAEFINLKSQIVISSWGGARRAAPYAFTEQGVAMLSSVLRSPRAVQVKKTWGQVFTLAFTNTVSSFWSLVKKNLRLSLVITRDKTIVD
jgi:hypothetical protein